MPKFFSLSASNPSVGNVPLILSQDLTTFLLDRPEDWDVSIIRFDIPNSTTPMFTFKSNFYYLNMTYNTHSVTLPVSLDPLITPANPQFYSWQAYIYLVNECLQNLWTALNALVTLPSTFVPYFVYNEVTQLTSLVVDKATYLSTITNTNIITINANDAFLSKISGFPMTFNGQPTTGTNTSFHYLFLDLKTNTSVINGNTCLTMTQQDQSFDNITDLTSIVISSNLPVDKEYVGEATAFPILNDFVVNDLTISTFRNRIVYNPPGPPFRQTHMHGSQPFRNVTCQVYLTDPYFNLTPVMLGPNESASIKLMFTPKKEQRY
jgi:hypothetical protein